MCLVNDRLLSIFFLNIFQDCIQPFGHEMLSWVRLLGINTHTVSKGFVQMLRVRLCYHKRLLMKTESYFVAESCQLWGIQSLMGWLKGDSKWARHELRQGWRRARRDCRETSLVKMNCKLWFVVIQRLPIYTSVEARDGIEWDSPAFDCTIDSEYFLEKFEEESLKEEGSHDVKFKSVPDPLSSFQTGCVLISHYFILFTNFNCVTYICSY